MTFISLFHFQWPGLSCKVAQWFSLLRFLWPWLSSVLQGHMAFTSLWLLFQVPSVWQLAGGESSKRDFSGQVLPHSQVPRPPEREVRQRQRPSLPAVPPGWGLVRHSSHPRTQHTDHSEGRATHFPTVSLHSVVIGLMSWSPLVCHFVSLLCCPDYYIISLYIYIY